MHAKMRLFLYLSLIFFVGALPLLANERGGNSSFVKLDLDKCTIINEDEESQSVTRHCNKLMFLLDLYVAEGDLRYYIGYGTNGREQRAFQQTLGPFNTIHDVLELRFRPDGIANTPYAAILRYFTAPGDEEPEGRQGQVLVVTKLQNGEACHIAYVDALANENANELARNAADGLADSFDCENDQPKIIGLTGESRM